MGEVRIGPKAIRRALSLDPNNARALYYDGLLQRRAGNTEQEIADFSKVVEMFPQSRDARRELGIYLLPNITYRRSHGAV